MADGKKNIIKRRLAWDNEGALEGMALYMIILVVIAAVAIGIIFTWFNSMGSDFSSIEVEASPNPAISDSSVTLVITAHDTEGNIVKDVNIEITGCEIVSGGITDENGVFEVTVTPHLPTNTDFGYITIKGIADGYTDETTIQVQH